MESKVIMQSSNKTGESIDVQTGIFCYRSLDVCCLPPQDENLAGS
jgi:hypothetical protein